MKQFIMLAFLYFIVHPAISQQISFVPTAVTIKTTTVKLNGTLNASLGGIGKTTIEINLPANTKEWYYSFTTRHDKAAENSTAQAIGLTAKIAGLLASAYTGGSSAVFTGLTESSIKSLAIPGGTIPINAYALDPLDVQDFRNAQRFHCIPGTANESQVNGNALVNSYLTGTAYIGLINPNARSGVLIDVEVTATVMKKKIIETYEEPVKIEQKKQPELGDNSYYIKNISDSTMRFEYCTNGVSWQEYFIKPGETKRMASNLSGIYIKYLNSNDEIVKSSLVSDKVYYFKNFMDIVIFSSVKN